jgi:hypothetical protein
MPSHRWAWLRTVGALLIVVLAFEYGVVPAALAARDDLSALGHPVWWAIVLGALLEAASLACFTCLTQTLLQPDRALPFATQWRIDLAGYGVSHVIPGGAAGSTALRVRLMGARGIPARVALAMIALQGGWSVFGLVLVWLLGVTMALPRTGPTATGVVLAGVASLGVSSVLLARADQTAAPRRLAGRIAAFVSARIPSAWREPVRPVTESVIRSLRDSGVVRTAPVWSIVNWLLDAACLWVCLAAYGSRLPIELVLSAYGLANVAGLLPFTPGGIGVVEGLLIPVLVAAGSPGGAAVLGVLTWRALQFWAPVPVGLACAASLGDRSRDRVRGRGMTDQHHSRGSFENRHTP